MGRILDGLLPGGIGGLAHTGTPALPWVGVGLLFVISALVPLRWEGVGAFLLIVVGLSAGIDNRGSAGAD
jgi:hypothetical protein